MIVFLNPKTYLVRMHSSTDMIIFCDEFHDLKQICGIFLDYNSENVENLAHVRRSSIATKLNE